MLAFLTWHRPAPSIEQSVYEHALEQLHRSLAHRPPSGFRGSMSFRAGEPPWLPVTGQGAPASGAHGEPARAVGQHAPAPAAAAPLAAASPAAAYEDWYLLDDWAAVGVLEEAAVSRGHVSVHDKVASRAEVAAGAVYRLIEGHPRLAGVSVSVWVERPRGQERPSLEALLGDGMDPAAGSLWRRCLGLGPAPELCLLAAELPAGVAAGRLPKGWTPAVLERGAVWDA